MTTQTTYCTTDGCEHDAVIGLTLCEAHAEECTCRCSDCEQRGAHYSHAEDGSDYGQDCPTVEG